jgi:hypothetical protein
MSTPGKEQVKRLAITVSSGSGSGTVTNQWDICRRWRLIPPSEAAIYTVTLKDADGHMIAKRTQTTGTLSEIDEISLGIVRTVEITSASEDGSYIAKFDMH